VQRPKRIVASHVHLMAAERTILRTVVKAEYKHDIRANREVGFVRVSTNCKLRGPLYEYAIHRADQLKSKNCTRKTSRLTYKPGSYIRGLRLPWLPGAIVQSSSGRFYARHHDDFVGGCNRRLEYRHISSSRESIISGKKAPHIDER
jgi:hypothetical protein